MVTGKLSEWYVILANMTNMIGLNVDITNAYDKAVCMNDQMATIFYREKERQVNCCVCILIRCAHSIGIHNNGLWLSINHNCQKSNSKIIKTPFVRCSKVRWKKKPALFGWMHFSLIFFFSTGSKQGSLSSLFLFHKMDFTVNNTSFSTSP